MRKLFFDHALLPGGWAEKVTVTLTDGGVIESVATGAPCESRASSAGAIAIPGLANLHSHAFQRAMAGLAEYRQPGENSFWSWRDLMYRFVARLTPDEVEAVAAQLYVEMLEAGFTAVGEFHYLHHQPDGTPYADPAEMLGRLAAAARAAGIGFTALPVLYAHSDFGGRPPRPEQRRFVTDIDGYLRLVDASQKHLAGLPGARLGIAPHSLRAVTPDMLQAVLAARPGVPVHIHIAEQMREVKDCLAWCGQRPVAWLLDHHALDARWCLVHATHMTAAESAALAASKAVAGLCPITEANLGDGIFAGAAYMAASGAWGIGSDSHVRVDAAEELRLLEYTQRLAEGGRNILGADRLSTGRCLLAAALRGGAQALGRPAGALAPGHWGDIVVLDEAHPALIARQGDGWCDGWIFSGDKACVRDVWVAGRQVVSQGRHPRREAIRAAFGKALHALLG